MNYPIRLIGSFRIVNKKCSVYCGTFPLLFLITEMGALLQMNSKNKREVIERFLLDKTHHDWREEVFLLVALVVQAIPSLLPVSVLR